MIKLNYFLLTEYIKFLKIAFFINYCLDFNYPTLFIKSFNLYYRANKEYEYYLTHRLLLDSDNFFVINLTYLNTYLFFDLH